MNSRVAMDSDRCSIAERAGGQLGWQVCGDWSVSGLYVSTRLFLLDMTRVEITEKASWQRYNVHVSFGLCRDSDIIPLLARLPVVR